MLFVLSPCGTSILSNVAGADRGLVLRYANTRRLNDVPPDDVEKLRAIVARAAATIADADDTTAARASAELNGIVQLYRDQASNPADVHWLLCTDTWLGEQTAHLVEQWLKRQGLQVVIHRQRDLRTDDVACFQLALVEIVGMLEQLVPAYRDKHYRVVFNLTGGFKRVQGFLQTLAMFYADETVYVFESSTDLLRIPRLPVKLDSEDTMRRYLPQMRRIAKGLPVDDVSAIPETLLLKIDSAVSLSPWGELLWKRSRSAIYSETLLNSPSAKLRFSREFLRSMRDLASDRICLINERLDDLARLLETGSPNPSSLDFKQLQGNPTPPSTHEVDAWSDASAMRLFGHYEGDAFVLDKFGPHL